MGKCQYSEGCPFSANINPDSNDEVLKNQHEDEIWCIISVLKLFKKKKINLWQQFWKIMACNNITEKNYEWVHFWKHTILNREQWTEPVHFKFYELNIELVHVESELSQL